MANPNELIKRIEELNKQVAQLHAERQKQLGMLESTKMQFESYVANYEKAYGVKLTAENLEAEYKNLMATCQTAADELEKQINYITSGAYKQAVQPTPIVENVVKTAPIPTGAGFGGFDTQPMPEQQATPVVQSIPVQQAAPVVQSTPVVQENTPTMIQGFGTNNAVTQPTFGAMGMPITKSAVPVVTEEVANNATPIFPVGWNTGTNNGGAGVNVNSLLSGQFGTKFGG